ESPEREIRAIGTQRAVDGGAFTRILPEHDPASRRSVERGAELPVVGPAAQPDGIAGVYSSPSTGEGELEVPRPLHRPIARRRALRGHVVPGARSRPDLLPAGGVGGTASETQCEQRERGGHTHIREYS